MTDLIPLSYINQYAYCPRRFWDMYVQGEMEENAHVLRGVINHERAHTPGQETAAPGVTVLRRVYVHSETLGVSGICDLVEVTDGGALTPIEYKQGRQGQWSNDQAQLCAQALCLEEMTGQRIAAGFIFYFGSRRRVEVRFDDALRSATVAYVKGITHTLAIGAIPPHTEQRRRCNGCSLRDICLPDETEFLCSQKPG